MSGQKHKTNFALVTAICAGVGTSVLGYFGGDTSALIKQRVAERVQEFRDFKESTRRELDEMRQDVKDLLQAVAKLQGAVEHASNRRWNSARRETAELQKMLQSAEAHAKESHAKPAEAEPELEPLRAGVKKAVRAAKVEAIIQELF